MYVPQKQNSCILVCDVAIGKMHENLSRPVKGKRDTVLISVLCEGTMPCMVRVDNRGTIYRTRSTCQHDRLPSIPRKYDTENYLILAEYYRLVQITMGQDSIWSSNCPTLSALCYMQDQVASWCASLCLAWRANARGRKNLSVLVIALDLARQLVVEQSRCQYRLP
jgi:hypothetical protein